MGDLPTEARAYVNFLSEQIGTEIGLVSTGPERSQTIIIHDSASASGCEAKALYLVLGTWCWPLHSTSANKQNFATARATFGALDARDVR